MATATLEEKNISSDLIHTLALFAKASYCKVKPTPENPEPEKDNTVRRLGFNPTSINGEHKTKLKTVA